MLRWFAKMRFRFWDFRRMWAGIGWKRKTWNEGKKGRTCSSFTFVRLRVKRGVPVGWIKQKLQKQTSRPLKNWSGKSLNRWDTQRHRNSYSSFTKPARFVQTFTGPTYFYSQTEKKKKKWIPSAALVKKIHISRLWQESLFGKLVAGENKLDWCAEHPATSLLRAARFELKRKTKLLHFLLLLIIRFFFQTWTERLRSFKCVCDPQWTPCSQRLCFSLPSIAFVSYFATW